MRFVFEKPFQLTLVEEVQSQSSISTVLQSVVNIFDDEDFCLDDIMDVRHTFSIALRVCVCGGWEGSEKN